jgi:hypothetical protein
MQKKMEVQTIQIVEKLNITKTGKSENKSTACCGGALVSNEDACCKLDEEKKAKGESGCGCNTPTVEKEGSNCC